MQTLLGELSKKINIELKEEQISKFISYKNLLKEWNEKINLTAIVEDKEIILKHFIDSLTVLKYIDENTSMLTYKNMNINIPIDQNLKDKGNL